MTLLLVVGAYVLAMLAGTALLIRLRPEWMLREVSHGDLDLFGLFTPEQRMAWDAEAADERESAARLNRADPDLRAYLSSLPWSAYRRDAHMFSAKQNAIVADVRGRLPTEYTSNWSDEGPYLAAFSPLLVLTLLPVSMVQRATARAVNTKTRTRVELEKELAAARKEVEELLGAK